MLHSSVRYLDSQKHSVEADRLRDRIMGVGEVLCFNLDAVCADPVRDPAHAQNIELPNHMAPNQQAVKQGIPYIVWHPVLTDWITAQHAGEPGWDLLKASIAGNKSTRFCVGTGSDPDGVSDTVVLFGGWNKREGFVFGSLLRFDGCSYASFTSRVGETVPTKPGLVKVLQQIESSYGISPQHIRFVFEHSNIPGAHVLGANELIQTLRTYSPKPYPELFPAFPRH